MMPDIGDFQDKYRSIKGMEKIYQLEPDFYYWSCLYKIKSVYIFKDYDYVEWKDMTNLQLVLSTSDEKLEVAFLFTDIVSFHLNALEGISGFEIAPNEDSAFGNERLFWISDYEDGCLHFYCREIEILHVAKG